MFLDKPLKPRNILVDVDAGTDDAWALFILLKAMDAGLCDIKAITCVNGNTAVNHVVRNVLRILKIVGKETLIPVYKGCAGPILKPETMTNKFVHGSDGFGDLKFEDEVNLSLIKSKHAVNAINDHVQEYPKDIELVFVGPLTNLAMAIRMYGDEVVDNVKAVWIMGGNYMGIGNITKSAEFNFYSDPEAAQIVLEAFSTSCPINILPWETCTERKLTIPVQWRFEELGVIENKITQLMNALDEMVYLGAGWKYFRPCDGLLAAIFLCPELAEEEGMWHASVELHGRHTRGQLVLDHLKAVKDNVRIVKKIDMEMFKRMLMWTVGHENQVEIRSKEA